MKKNRKLRVRVRFILFILNAPSLTCDVTSSILNLDGKKMRKTYQIKKPHKEKYTVVNTRFKYFD